MIRSFSQKLFLALILASFGLNAVGTKSQAQVLPSMGCRLAVCDISSEIERYKKMTEQEKFSAIESFRNAYKKTKDAAIFKNMMEFSTALQNAFKETNQPEYLITRASFIYGDAVLGLSKFSDPNAETLAGFYKQIKGEQGRIEILSTWRTRMAEYEDKKNLFEILKFFALAAKISEADGDPVYVAGTAYNGEKEITARIVRLYPYFEGIYDIKVTCVSDDNTQELPTYCRENFINRAIIMDTQFNQVEISFSNKESGTMVYTFGQVALSDEGSKFEATGNYTGILSKVQLFMDRDTGMIHGSIQNTDSLFTIKIEGSLSQSPVRIFDYASENPNTASIEQAALNRVFKGVYGGDAVTLRLRSIGNDLGGTLSFDKFPGQKINFQYSKYYPKSGILSMVASQQNGVRIKMVLFFKPDGSALAVKGLCFTSLNGDVQEIEMKSVTAVVNSN